MPGSNVANFMKARESVRFVSPPPEIELPTARGWGLPEWFAVAQVAGPALLYLPGTQVIRAPLRVGVFALSLIGLAICLQFRRPAAFHKSALLLAAAAGFMFLMIFHPATNTMVSAIAQIAMYLAVAAPIFWAPSYFHGDYKRLSRVLTILWILNGASVIVGILQVRDPATWMPAEFTSILKANKQSVSMYQYQGADGGMTMRPPGLGDSPGAACGAGMFVGIMTLAYMGLPVSTIRKLCGFGMGIAGVVVILLSHVRSSLLVLVGCAFIYSIILAWQGRIKVVIISAAGVAACGTVGFFYGHSMGGEATLKRFETLLADDPLTVYEKSNRMWMLTSTWETLLVDYPLGAGLGRWGMMRTYFGDESNVDSPPLYAEVQFPAWAIDGGYVMLLLYPLALILAIARLLHCTLFHPSPRIRQWGAVIVMLSAGPIALTFSYTPFNSQIGMQFWLLIGAFEGLVNGEDEITRLRLRRFSIVPETRMPVRPSHLETVAPLF
jgi:hypothetical protein